MNKVLNILLWLLFPCTLVAQELDSVFSQLSFKDKTFNAAEEQAKTFEGYDVDITRPGQINLGIQVAQDVVAMTSKSKEMLEHITKHDYYKQRMDLMLSAALPERTNVYTILSFVATGSNTVNLAVVNMELEHYFPGNHVKFRVGRLINKLSESQYFSRIALGESAAHVFGRSPFENDALEFDLNLKDKGLPVFFLGIKNRYDPVNIGGVYAGFHHRFKQKTQIYFVASALKQFENELKVNFPEYHGQRWHYAYEAEVAYRERAYAVFCNIGGYINYIGMMPHASGRHDFFQQFRPLINDGKRALKETFTPSVGFRLKPALLNQHLKFIPIMGVESELLGGFTERLKALNIYGYIKFNITNRLIFTYACNPQFVWNKREDEMPVFQCGTTNFFRLSLTVGKPTRMMM